jgi:MoxR-like ATPase
MQSNSAISVAEIEREIERHQPIIQRVQKEVSKVIVGQRHMVNSLLIGLLADGHILLEGAPGLAKTLTIRSLSKAISLRFKRIQFTPDLLPADLVGTEIYSPKTGEFSTRKGPVFTNILLADEINRAPPKVQSALLESMQERQVTIGGKTYGLPKPFLVLATQNPLEQEGTYPLPEAQADRFMMKVVVDYPTVQEERDILLQSTKGLASISSVATAEELFACRNLTTSIRFENILVDYIISIVRATRNPAAMNIPVGRYIEFGASPRASLAMMQAAKALAFLSGKGFVTPDDIKSVGADVLRHRILLTYEAEAEGITTDWIIQQIFQRIPTP